MKVYVVHGSPLSGKTSYVKKRIGRNDIVFDYDKIHSALSFRPDHDHNINLMPYVLDIREMILRKLKSEEKIDNAWIITTKIGWQLRNDLVGLNPEYIKIESDMETCLERLEANPDGRDKELWTKLIVDYHTTNNNYKVKKKFYGSYDWKQKRKAIHIRDENTCQECKRYGKRVDSETIHHIYPLEERYDLRLISENLIALCQQCHEEMHNPFNKSLSKKGQDLLERTRRKYPWLDKPIF